MYTTQEASALRQKFWISFGKYMSPVPSAAGEKINWINYRTGVKSTRFKMDATSKSAYIGIEISHKDHSVTQLYFNQFEGLRNQLEELLEENWQWHAHAVNDAGKNIAQICTTIENVNVFDENDWQMIISFLKKRMIALDAFWNEYHEIFETIPG